MSYSKSHAPVEVVLRCNCNNGSYISFVARNDGRHRSVYFSFTDSLPQSCIAMLSYPGGLYLDVKSGYSTAQQHKWFASTLAGIGINVKVWLVDISHNLF